MARKTMVLGFSVSPEMAEEYAKLAEQEKTTKSELFRPMIACNKADRGEEEFFKLQRKMSRRSGKDGTLSEKEVERIVFEDR